MTNPGLPSSPAASAQARKRAGPVPKSVVVVLLIAFAAALVPVLVRMDANLKLVDFQNRARSNLSCVARSEVPCLWNGWMPLTQVVEECRLDCAWWRPDHPHELSWLEVASGAPVLVSWGRDVPGLLHNDLWAIAPDGRQLHCTDALSPEHSSDDPLCAQVLAALPRRDAR